MNNETPKKKKGCFQIGLIIFAIIIVLQLVIGGIFYLFESDEDKANREKQEQIELLEAKKEERISELNGFIFRAERNAASILQKSLKDPKSYDEISKSGGYTKDSLIVVDIVYRATNSFGAYLQDKKQFVFSKDGDRLIDAK